MGRMGDLTVARSVLAVSVLLFLRVCRAQVYCLFAVAAFVRILQLVALLSLLQRWGLRPSGANQTRKRLHIDGLVW